MSENIYKLKELLKMHLPKNAAVIIQKSLLEKGYTFNKQYIQQNLKLNGKNPNSLIINEAVEICNKIVEDRIQFIEKTKQLNKMLAT